MAKLRCAFCKEYADESTCIRVGLSSFCSEEHMIAKANKTRSSAARKTTTRRREAVKKRAGITPEMRESVILADSGRCRFCGSIRYDFECHHVYYRSEASHLPWVHERHNLLTLCTYCHGVVHGDKKRFQPLALQIVWLRDVLGDRHTTIQELIRTSNNK